MYSYNFATHFALPSKLHLALVINEIRGYCSKLLALGFITQRFNCDYGRALLFEATQLLTQYHNVDPENLSVLSVFRDVSNQPVHTFGSLFEALLDWVIISSQETESENLKSSENLLRVDPVNLDSPTIQGLKESKTLRHMTSFRQSFEHIITSDSANSASEVEATNILAHSSQLSPISNKAVSSAQWELDTINGLIEHYESKEKQLNPSESTIGDLQWRVDRVEQQIQDRQRNLSEEVRHTNELFMRLGLSPSQHSFRRRN